MLILTYRAWHVLTAGVAERVGTAQVSCGVLSFQTRSVALHHEKLGVSGEEATPNYNEPIPCTARSSVVSADIPRLRTLFIKMLVVCLSVCLSVRSSVRPSVCPFICLSVCRPVRLSACRSVGLSCPSVCRPACLSVCRSVGRSILPVRLSICQHGLAIQSAPAPPCPMGRKAGYHRWNTASHAPPSPGRHVLSIADNLEAAPKP